MHLKTSITLTGRVSSVGREISKLMAHTSASRVGDRKQAEPRVWHDKQWTKYRYF